MAGWGEWNRYKTFGRPLRTRSMRQHMLGSRLNDLPAELAGGSEAIYALVDGASRVRYIGRTADPRARFRQHVQGACAATAPWIESLPELEFPRMVVLDVVPANAAAEREMACMREHRERGAELLNDNRLVRRRRLVCDRARSCGDTEAPRKSQLTEPLELPFGCREAGLNEGE